MLLEAAEETVRAEENGSGEKVAAYYPLEQTPGKGGADVGAGGQKVQSPKEEERGHR